MVGLGRLARSTLTIALVSFCFITGTAVELTWTVIRTPSKIALKQPRIIGTRVSVFGALQIESLEKSEHPLMKIELPIAVAMLAGCVAAWSTGFIGSNAAVIGSSNNPVAVNRVQQQPVATNQTANESNEVLRNVAQQVRNIGPLVADTSILVNMFGQQIRSAGRYYQMGQGSRKSRLESAFDVGNTTATIIQICDGHIYYRHESMGDQASLDIAYLEKLASADRRMMLADSKTWMATGGLASLMTNLANNFDFQPIAIQTNEFGIQSSVMKGQWNEGRLRRLMYGQINQNLVKNKIQWDRLPPHIPATVEIYLQQLEDGSYFPCLLYTSPSPRDATLSRMPSSA